MAQELLQQPSLPIPAEAIAALCRRWDVARLALFGSILQDDFGPLSDVDVLVTFGPEANPDLFSMIGMEQELETLFGRSVDLVSSHAIDRSRNWLRRREILGSARTIYAR